MVGIDRDDEFEPPFDAATDKLLIALIDCLKLWQMDDPGNRAVAADLAKWEDIRLRNIKWVAERNLEQWRAGGSPEIAAVMAAAEGLPASPVATNFVKLHRRGLHVVK